MYVLLMILERQGIEPLFLFLADLKEKFSWIYKQEAENTRNLHIHVTCATDSSSTSIVLNRSRCPSSTPRGMILLMRICSTRGDIYGQLPKGEFVVIRPEWMYLLYLWLRNLVILII